VRAQSSKHQATTNSTPMDIALTFAQTPALIIALAIKPQIDN
jgi:hypothetical protein